MEGRASMSLQFNFGISSSIYSISLRNIDDRESSGNIEEGGGPLILLGSKYRTGFVRVSTVVRGAGEAEFSTARLTVTTRNGGWVGFTQRLRTDLSISLRPAHSLRRKTHTQLSNTQSHSPFYLDICTWLYTALGILDYLTFCVLYPKTELFRPWKTRFRPTTSVSK